MADRALLEQMVENDSEYLYRYAYRYFRSDSVAEELVQEVFLAAAERIGAFRGDSTPRTWLTSILRFKIMDRFKRQSKEDQTQDSFDHLFDQHEHWRDEVGPFEWSIQPEKTLQQKEFFVVLNDCLRKLPDAARQIFLLREVGGFERQAICEKLSLTSSNVGVMLHRARVHLQYCLQQNWFLSEERR